MLLLLACIFALPAFGQQDIKTVRTSWVDSLKIMGQMTGKEQYVNYSAQPISMPASNQRGVVIPNQTTATSCNCWLPRDATWQIGQFDGSGGSGGPGVAPEYRNDDWTTPIINLPFNFCFYGTTVTQVYLNNNGNVSIGAPYSTFTANTFPDPTYTMIAPFWGDVDTRAAGSGLVYYQLTATHLVVQWESVGYFGNHDDLLNTFQLIMTDGSDPLLPPGNNVQFCYRDMQWTTGDASGGSGGFGGTAATVGVNKGNGIDYIQIGLYDQAGAAYDGPFGANDGIDMLDNQTFLFNVCVSGTSNIPPLINSDQVCDTLSVCENDTLIIDAVYLSPEFGQITVPNVNANGMPGVSTLSSTSGNIALQQVQIIGQPGNVGYHTIFLEGTDNGTPAQTASAPIVIRVIPAPNSNFTVSPTGIQMPGTLFTFTNTSVGGFSAVWDFGDGSPPSSLYNTSHIYGSGGTYTVTLTVTSPNGCTDVFTQQVQIQQCGTASFTTSNVCAGSPSLITFTGTAGVGATYNWNFAGGTVVSGSGQGPYNVVWNTPGNYNVTVDVSSTGCSNVSASQGVTIQAVPNASISAAAAVCAGQNNAINFNGTAGAGATYAWTFGGGTVTSGSGAGPYNVNWAAPGNPNLQVIVTENGCRDTANFAVTVNAIPTSPFTVPSSACEGTPMTVTYTGTAGGAANYSWNFNGGTVLSGSGQGPYSIQWNNAGNYNVSLTVTENGCTSAPTSVAVTMNDYPVAAFTADNAVCIGEDNTINFSGTAIAGATYNWNFGSGTVGSGSGSGPYVVHWANAGNETVTLIVNQNGCRDTSTFNVRVNPIPNSTFSLPTPVCEGTPMSFAYTGTAGAGATYNWTFTNGTVQSGSGPGPLNVLWNDAGTYAVSLTVTENGCTSPVTNQQVTLYDYPVAAVSGSPTVCVNGDNAISFTGTAIPGATYSWNFGNGTLVSGSGAGPYTVRWAADGTATVSVLVSQNGCSDSSTFNVRIYPIPTSAFSIPPNVCVNDPLSISYTGSASATATYTWNFGSGSVLAGSGSGPYSVVWNTSGNPAVTLTVTENGCVSPVTTLNTFIAPLPVPHAGLDVGDCSGTSVNIGAPPIAGETYSWSPALGLADPAASSTSVSLNNIGTNNRTDRYILTVTSSYGCVNRDTVDVTAFPVPAATFARPTGQCLEDNAFTFNAGGLVFPGVDLQWDFSPSASTPTSTDQNPQPVSYSAPGVYTVTLHSSYNGCPGPDYIDSIEVFGMPVASFEPLVINGCEPLTVPFLNTSVGDINTYEWNYFDGAGDAIAEPSHTFEKAGTYTVMLVVTSNEGCRADTILPNIITVWPQPVAGFIPNPSVTTIWEPVISFDNTTIKADSYKWDFGDSTSTSLHEPTHRYTQVGAYLVTLYTINQYGCADTAIGTIRVEQGFNFYVPNAFTPNGDGVNDTFRGLGTSFKTYELWIYNRWGRQIYYTNDYEKPWDGSMDDPVQNEVFTYRIRVVDIFDKDHTYLGHVSVVR